MNLSGFTQNLCEASEVAEAELITPDLQVNRLIIEEQKMLGEKENLENRLKEIEAQLKDCEIDVRTNERMVLEKKNSALESEKEMVEKMQQVENNRAKFFSPLQIRLQILTLGLTTPIFAMLAGEYFYANILAPTYFILCLTIVQAYSMLSGTSHVPLV